MNKTYPSNDDHFLNLSVTGPVSTTENLKCVRIYVHKSYYLDFRVLGLCFIHFRIRFRFGQLLQA